MFLKILNNYQYVILIDFISNLLDFISNFQIYSFSWEMTLCDITTVSTFPQAKNWQNIVNTAFPHNSCTSASHSSWCATNLLQTGVKETLNIPVHPKGYQSCVFIEGLMLRLKLQYFGHLMRRVDSLEKTMLLGGIRVRRRRGRQRMRWLDGITDSMDVNLSEL